MTTARRDYHPPLVSDEFARQAPKARPLIGSEVDRTADGRAISVVLVHSDSKFDVRDRSQTTHHVEHSFVLSPPAAAQLARDLESAVQEYLYGDEETE